MKALNFFKSSLFYLFVVVSLSSCKNKSDFEQKLINNNWLYYPYDEYKGNKSYMTYIRFYENNTYKNFYLTSNLEHKTLDHSNNKMGWSYNKEQKVLTLLEFKFKVIEIQGDTIWMQKIDDNVKVGLIKYVNVEGANKT